MNEEKEPRVAPSRRSILLSEIDSEISRISTYKNPRCFAGESLRVAIMSLDRIRKGADPHGMNFKEACLTRIEHSISVLIETHKCAVHEYEMKTKKRVKIKRKTISQRLRFYVMNRDKFSCVYCGRRSGEARLAVDHVVSVKDGGTDNPLNLVTSCYDCNLGKGEKSVSEDVGCHKIDEYFKDWNKR